MAAQTNNLHNLQELKNEIGLLRSFIIGIAGKDKEGNYRPEFIRRILRAANEKPAHLFHSAKGFSEHVHKCS